MTGVSKEAKAWTNLNFGPVLFEWDSKGLKVQKNKLWWAFECISSRYHVLIVPCSSEAVDGLRQRITNVDSLRRWVFGRRKLLWGIAISLNFCWFDFFHKASIVPLTNGKMPFWCFIWEHAIAVRTLFASICRFLNRLLLSCILQTLLQVVRLTKTNYPFHNFWLLHVGRVSFLRKLWHPLDLRPCRNNSWFFRVCSRSKLSLCHDYRISRSLIRQMWSFRVNGL